MRGAAPFFFFAPPGGAVKKEFCTFVLACSMLKKTKWGKIDVVVCTHLFPAEAPADEKSDAVSIWKRHRGIFRSLVLGAARRLFLKGRREYIVHQQDQLQHAAEMAFHLLLFPDDGTLPTCMLSENNANHKGGKGWGDVVPLPVLSGVGQRWNRGMIKKCPVFHTFLGKVQII
jgi:hypothetical protein